MSLQATFPPLFPVFTYPNSALGPSVESVSGNRHVWFFLYPSVVHVSADLRLFRKRHCRESSSCRLLSVLYRVFARPVRRASMQQSDRRTGTSNGHRTAALSFRGAVTGFGAAARPGWSLFPQRPVTGLATLGLRMFRPLFALKKPPCCVARRFRTSMRRKYREALFRITLRAGFRAS